MRTKTLPSGWVGHYGPRWKSGVLSEHMHRFLSDGGHLRKAETFEGWAVDENGRAWPIVCSELVSIDTEDGPIVGRCGHKAVGNGLCEYHYFEGEVS